jgi:putative transposase
MSTTYPTDLSDAEWTYLEPHLPAPKATGRPRLYPLREILNAIFYILRSGCSWRLLPHDLERRGGGVYHYLRGCMPPCVSGSGSVSTETLSLALAS